MAKVLFKNIIWKVLLLGVTAVVIFFISDCSDRENAPVTLEDSTIIYPSKSEDGINIKITFSNKISRKSKKPLNVDSVFNIRKKAKVYATVELINYKSQIHNGLSFHIDWLDSTGNSFYKKRIDISPSKTASKFSSSISISPKKRDPGEYKVRIYLFRELIAEKKFELVDSHKESVPNKKKEISNKKSKSSKNDGVKKSTKPKIQTEVIKAKIILCRKLSRKTGNPIGVGTTFTIKEKAKLKAIVNVEKEKIKTNEQMTFYLKWKEPDGKVFYKKRIVYTSSNPNFTITNSITITPEKRLPGNYTLQVVFHKKIIAEQNFELIAQTK
jgi:hypothetical protein